jgi:hypothetical protein
MVMWFARFVGLRVEDALPVGVRRGEHAQIVGNAHGRPDHLLVRRGNVMETQPITDVTPLSAASAAWIQGYLDGYKVDVVDLWSEPLYHDTPIEELDNQVETCCRMLAIASRWTDPHTADTPLLARPSPFEGCSFDAYGDHQQLTAFLAASTAAWWASFEWQCIVEAAIAEAWPEDPDGEYEGWRTQDVVADRVDRVAGCLAAVDEPDLAGKLARTSYEFKRDGEEVRPARLRRSRNAANLVINEEEERIYSVTPAGPHSAWWLRGYLAGREPSIELVRDWNDAAVTDALWRMVVRFHHFRGGDDPIATMKELHAAAT